MKEMSEDEKTALREKYGITPQEQAILEKVRKTNIDEDDTHYMDTPAEYRDDADDYED